ncbi:MAG: 2-oxo acid dehydrogenase subunit E2 [Deltaproteobacteria bacterium]|nr:2-oxo acid dehydrogenase subunit E2 [Deltaproteobacteria bacterium]
MAHIVIMPKLGFNMDEGQLVKWHKKVGERVVKGDTLFDIHTDKTTMPVESTVDGVLLKIMLQEWERAPVFTPVAVLGQAGEDPDAALAAAGAPASATAQADAPSKNPGGAAPSGQGVPVSTALRLTPKARKMAQEEGLYLPSLASVQGTGFQGGITARDIKASPLARKTAAQAGVDLASVHGTGIGGKVMQADVRAAAPAPHAETKKIYSVQPYSGIRRIIGERLADSKFSAPHAYFADSVDVARLNAFRAQLLEGGVRAGFSDLLILAVCKALRRYPEINVSLEGDRIVAYAGINIGLAVAGNNGLVVPVVKDAQEKSLENIAAETRDLVERARAGRLLPEEYSGGTFTISNLGPFGLEDFTAIINPPEAAILAVSAVRKKAVVISGADGEDAIAVRPVMGIRLSADHRLIDGLLAANFIKYLKELLENPIRMLV